MDSKKWKQSQIEVFNEKWYFKKNRFAFLSRLHIVNRILNKLNPKFILDVGTGDGELPVKIILNDKLDKRIIGVDISKDLVRLATKITKKYKLTESAQYIVADLENLPFQNATFDSIICTAVLEHVFNQKRAIIEMARTCKNKNFVTLTIPNFLFHRIFQLLAVIGLRYRDTVCDRNLRVERLEKLLSGSGLRTVFKRNFVLPLPSFLDFIERFLKRLKVRGFHLLLNQLLILRKVE